MIEARYKNGAGYTFILWEGNPFVEVFRPADLDVSLRDAIPFEVLALGALGRNEASLKKIGNERAEYARL